MDEKLVHNPTPFSSVFNAIAENASESFERSISGSFFARVKLEARIRAYLMNGYKETHEYFRRTDLPKKTGDTKRDLIALMEAFEDTYPRIIFNNLVLAHHVKGSAFTVDLKTEEDEKNALLAKVAQNASECSTFEQEYGHYALNSYEVAERRFSEYSCEELQNLGKHIAGIPLQKKPSLAAYVQDHASGANASLLIGIRELGKFQALKIVAEIRYILLEIESTYELERPVFDYTYNELLQEL